MSNPHFPVLILGLGRSGSKLLRQILNHNDDVYIGPELNFYFAFRDNLLRRMRAIGDLSIEANVDKLIELIYSEQIHKTHLFTKPIPQECLRNALLNGDRTNRNVFESLLRSRAKVRKSAATVVGAKFPFHFSFVKEVLEWYPDAKIVFLLRDPRAIIASELRKKAEGRSLSSGFPRFKSPVALRVAVITYVVGSTYWYSRIIKRYRHLDNVCISKYEQLILKPEASIRRLCDFLDISYTDKMKNVNLSDSSFDTGHFEGFKLESLKNWEKELGNGQKALLGSLLGGFLDEYGY